MLDLISYYYMLAMDGKSDICIRETLKIDACIDASNVFEYFNAISH